MNSHELARALLAGPDKPVELRIANGKDTAYTRAEIKVGQEDDATAISGFVWSDDEAAYAPWAPEAAD